MYISTLLVVISTFITIIITIGMFAALSVFVYRESRRNDKNHDQESLPPPRTISAPFNVRRIHSITPEDLAVFSHPHLNRARSQANVPASKASHTPFTPPADMPTPSNNPAADEPPQQDQEPPYRQQLTSSIMQNPYFYENISPSSSQYSTTAPSSPPLETSPTDSSPLIEPEHNHPTDTPSPIEPTTNPIPTPSLDAPASPSQTSSQNGRNKDPAPEDWEDDPNVPFEGNGWGTMAKYYEGEEARRLGRVRLPSLEGVRYHFGGRRRGVEEGEG